MDHPRRASWSTTTSAVGSSFAILLIVVACATSGPNGASSNPSTLATQPAEAASATPTEPEAPSDDPSDATVGLPVRTVEESGGFRLTAQSSASCTADAPAGWTMVAAERSDRADLFSPDGSMYAGYGIQAINTSLAQHAAAYDAPLNDPDMYSADPSTVAIGYGRVVVGAIGGAPDIVGDELYQPTDDYLLTVVAGSTHQGAIFFHGSGFAGDGINYAFALPMYFAFATTDRWEQMGPLVARVAASIRCTTQFQPPEQYFVVEAANAATADANGDEDGYNPQLGTEYANDPLTGENYLVDPALNWSETGPDGPGYYVPKGGYDYQKLEPGRID
jgi:hypothetical protein